MCCCTQRRQCARRRHGQIWDATCFTLDGTRPRLSSRFSKPLLIFEPIQGANSSRSRRSSPFAFAFLVRLVRFFRFMRRRHRRLPIGRFIDERVGAASLPPGAGQSATSPFGGKGSTRTGYIWRWRTTRRPRVALCLWPASSLSGDQELRSDAPGRDVAQAKVRLRRLLKK